MRVAILTQYYPPEPIAKPHELARGLTERGHEVVVVTAFPNYPAGKLYPGTRLRHFPAFREFQKGGIASEMRGVSNRLAHLTTPPFENFRKLDHA